jgi:anti-sigma regulatory factor (Ser/Thr protein kinase)
MRPAEEGKFGAVCRKTTTRLAQPPLETDKFINDLPASYDNMNMNSRLILSNRRENVKLLTEYVRKWAGDHGLPANRRRSLEKAAKEIFRHLLTHAYRPGQPGSIALALEQKGPRLRLMFEDDAAPHNPTGLSSPTASEDPPRANGFFYNGLQKLAESLVYYRTADRKNRLVIFMA